MKCSIITPTIRKEGLDVIRDSLIKQHHNDWEWLIGSPFNPNIKEAIWIKDDFSGGYWSLNRIYNRLFRKSRNSLIISWQDWIWAPPDGLSKFVSAHESYPNAIIAGVGDQYEKRGKFGKPEIKVWSDPRKTKEYGSFYEVNPNDAEWNWCAIPKKAIYDIGGMDEKLDFLGYGGDQLQAVERMEACGYRFYLDQTNESYTIRHDRSDFGGQDKWDKHHVLFNGKYKERKQSLLVSGNWPRLKHL